PRPVHLVTQTPVLDVIGLGITMFASQIAPLSALVDVAILQQRSRLFRRSGSEVQSHQGEGPDGFAPGHVLVCSELVRVHRVPGLIQNLGTILFRADTVQPVVSGDKVSSGITNDRNPKRLYL